MLPIVFLSIFRFVFTIGSGEVSKHFLNLKEGEAVVATVIPDDKNGSLDCYLLDNDNKIKAEDENGGSCELVYTNATSGTYHIEIVNMSKYSTRYTVQASTYKYNHR